MQRRWSIAVWSCLLFCLLAPVSAQLPYNPTHILRNGSSLYIFQPASEAQFQLDILDISGAIQPTDLQTKTLYSSLPFLDSGIAKAFTPVLDDGGNITVYTGSCNAGAEGAELWTFTPDTSDTNGNGSWKQEDVSPKDVGNNNAVTGANFLNAGASFSTLVKSNASNVGAYFFGGMCPYETSTQGSWLSSANYSNLMVTIDRTSTAETIGYQIGVSASKGPPIREAGFSMTGLEPSYWNSTDEVETQQQVFVLVGGHTSEAFINMSQVALFSLPQEGWTFLPIDPPNTERTDLAVRTDITEIGPRSGHTAVLTPDGQRIVVFGGWVGDTSTPADPQFAILNVGEGYGGQGSWEWSVPTTSGRTLATGAGIYGHGAVMLPGGVMMIMGGYSIPASSGSRHRRTAQTANTQTFFLNTTSNVWATEYSPPNDFSGAQEQNSTGPLSKTSQKAGLAVGIGIGCAAVVGLLFFYLWYNRRLKKQRDLREKELRDLAYIAHRYTIPGVEGRIDGRSGSIDASHYTEAIDHGPYPIGVARSQSWRRGGVQEAERTGLLVEIPSPTRGLRRSLSGRGSHHLIPRYDDRRVRGSGDIHPIDELEEEENDITGERPSCQAPEMTERSGADPLRTSAFSNAPTLDPFTDAHPLSSHPVSGQPRDYLTSSAPPSPDRENADNPRAWSPDWNLAATALLARGPSSYTGRVSPDRSDRTGSNLSERSTRSNLSSRSSGAVSVGRSVSIRSAAMLSNTIVNPFTTPEHSPTREKHHRRSGGGQSATEPRTRSFTSTRPGTANGDADSFVTARSNFVQLQAEGEALLGGRPDTSYTSSSGSVAGSHTYQDTTAATSTVVTAATSTDFRPTRERRKSWLGSVRRALGRTAITASDEDRTKSLTATVPSTDWPVASPTTSGRTSPAKAAPPRRAASDASFWRSKRGARDWDVDIDGPVEEGKPKWRRNSGDDWGAPEDEEVRQREQEEAEMDWDVEAAVEARMIQVSFTVPRTRLRVVNTNDTDSMRSVSGISRLGSVRSKKSVDRGGGSHEGTREDIKEESNEERRAATPVPAPPSPPRSPARSTGSPGSKVAERVRMFEGDV